MSRKNYRDLEKPADASAETMKELDDANKGKDAQVNEFQAAETRGRAIMANTPAETAKTKPVPVQGFVKAGVDATARGRAMIQEAHEARKGLDVFPPARLLNKKP
jgi:hypothetical protein